MESKNESSTVSRGKFGKKHFYKVEDFDDSNSKINFHVELSQFLLRRPFLQPKLDKNMKLILQT